MNNIKNLFIVFATLFAISDGANILGLFTSSSPSHVIVHMSIIKSLVEKGHNATVVTTLPLKDKNPQYKHLHLPPKEGTVEALTKGIEEIGKVKNPFAKISIMTGNIKTMTNLQYDAILDDKFQSLIKSEKFDLVIIGYFFNDYQIAVASQLKVPIILSWMGAPIGSVNSVTGNPTLGSVVPNMLVSTKQPMDFKNRLATFLADAAFYGLEEFGVHKYRQYYDEYVKEFGLKDMPSFDEMRKNVSLVFCNSHFSEGPIRPNVPAIVEIGGIQIKDKPDPLEPKLKEFLDKSTNGAILFSMGSNVKVSTLDPKIIKTLYNVFSKLKQNVLWKWEDPNPASFPGNSKNILFSKWIPQDDVLAHKNMKLFVTHGGKGSVVESQYHGIPMIGLPVFGDQPGNIDKIVKVGYGLKLDYKTMTEEELSAAVNEVLNNPSYAANIKKFADTYKDRPMSARESVVFWTEYVIRHHGAPHLQSPLVHMNVIQQYSIDVLAVIFAVCYVLYRTTKFTICFLWSKIRSKKCGAKNKKNKNKKE